MEIVYPTRIVESRSRSTNKRILISTPNLFMPPPVPVNCTPTTLVVDNILIVNRQYDLVITINDGESKVVTYEPDGHPYDDVRLPGVLQDIFWKAGVSFLDGGGGYFDFYRERNYYNPPTISFYGNECPPDNEVCNITTVTIEPLIGSDYENILYPLLAKNGEPRIIMRSCASLYAPGT